MIENEGKPGQKIVTIYDDIYDLPDCRSYYRAMDHAGFGTAHHAVKAFRPVLAELKRRRGLQSTKIMDFASGYGIAAALMRHDISLDDILLRYRDSWFDDAETDDVIKADKTWLSERVRPDQSDRYGGIDIAGNALKYGEKTGIFDAGFAENLQDDEPSGALNEWLQDCELVVECGSVIHMLPGALEKVLRSTASSEAWICGAPIRGNDTAEAFDMMRDYGREPVILPVSPFRHRSFSSEEEQARGIENAQARGHETSGYEDTGFFHAQVFLAQPKSEAMSPDEWQKVLTSA